MTIVTERLRERAPVASTAVRDQATVASGQIASGVGNMLFSLVMARLLAPGAFAQLTSFLALYLLLSMPATAISAAAALAPDRAARLRPLLWCGGATLGVALAVTSPWVGPVLRLPVPMVVVLGLSGPALGTLALERGRLYSWRRYGRLVASLMAEPAVRLVLGTVLAMLGGGVGGAFGVTVGGYAALEIARRHRRARSGNAPGARGTGLVDPVPAATRTAGLTALAFLALVVVQNQDLLIANRVLSPGQAGQFAVLSTLGGLSAFATMTVPLVLLPRSAAGETGDLVPALSLTALIGGVAVGIVALAPGPLVTLLFGARYREVGAVLVPYVAAMALLGIARVLVAHRCATGSGRSSIVVVALAVVLQAALIVELGHGPRSVAYSTVAAVTGLTVSLGTAEAVHRLELRRRLSGVAAVATRPLALVVTGACVLGLGIRLVVPRGLWLDEATSVYQARMGYGAMIHNLRTTDVHPPLYFSVLWVTIRWLGSGEMAVRLPSIVAGSLVVPMLYLLGREAYDRRTGAVAAVAGSVAPILVWYSQEARMYALLALFGVIAMWAQIRIIRRGERFAWLAYALASIALGWTQYFGLLQVVVQQAAFLCVIAVRYRRGQSVRSLVIGWVATAVAIAVLLAPLLGFAYQQFMVNQTAGKGFGGPQQTGSATSLSGNHLNVYTAIANVLWAIWGYHSDAVMALLGALWPLGMLFALVLLGRRHRWPTTLLIAAVLVPGVAMFALGSVKRDLFDIRYLSTAVPILFVLIARVVTGIPRRLGAVVAGTSLVVVSLLAGLIDQQYNGSNPRQYDFRGALAAVESRAHPGDLVLYDPVDLREVVEYYSPRLELAPLGTRPPQAGSDHPVFVVASRSLMNGPSDAATLSRVLKTLRAHGHEVVHRDFANVQMWEFR